MKTPRKIIIGLVKSTLEKFGFVVIRVPKPPDCSLGPLYEKPNVLGTYSPWNTDESFIETYLAVKDFTLVDKYRCWVLWKLIEQSKKIPKGSILEVGVWRGGTGALIAKQAVQCGIRETVYLCDTFSGVVKSGVNDPDYKNGRHNDTDMQTVEGLIFDRMKLPNVKLFPGIFPDETGMEIEKQDASFRFCHIDVDVYQSAKDVIDWIWDKLETGGIVVYDDYGTQDTKGITQLVNEQMMIDDRLVIHNLSGQAIVIKR